MVDSAAQGPVGWIREIVLNSPHPRTLAEFRAQLVGGSPVECYDGWITLEPPPHGQRLSFQHSDEAGDRASVHVDILVEDLDAAHERVLAVGGEYLAEWRGHLRPHRQDRQSDWGRLPMTTYHTDVPIHRPSVGATSTAIASRTASAPVRFYRYNGMDQGYKATPRIVGRRTVPSPIVPRPAPTPEPPFISPRYTAWARAERTKAD